MDTPVSDQLWRSGAAVTGGQPPAVPGGRPDGADGAVGLSGAGYSGAEPDNQRCCRAGRTAGHGRDDMAGFPDGQNPAALLVRGFFPGVLHPASDCAGHSGAVTGVVSLAATG